MKGTPRPAWLLLAIVVTLFTLLRLMTSQRTKAQVASSSSEPRQVTDQPTTASPEPISQDETRPEQAAKGRLPNGRSAISLALAASLLATLVGAGAVLAADESPDFTEPLVPATGMNTSLFWELFLAANYGGDWNCETVNSNPDPVVLAADHGAVIIKAGPNYYGYVPAPAGEYSAPVNSTSHYYVCDQDFVPDIILPTGDILGPCADPAYYAFFDNSGSDTAIRFRFTWYNNLGYHVASRVVPAGATYTTWQHWVKPFTQMKVGYKDPATGIWINLVKETSVQVSFPICEYEPGFSFPGT
jgi:hypothetical protein